MNEKQIRQLKPMLSAFLKRFDDCFPRKDTRAHLQVYVEGQLSNLPRACHWLCQCFEGLIGMELDGYDAGMLHRKTIHHDHKPGHLHQFSFSCCRRMQHWRSQWHTREEGLI